MHHRLSWRRLMAWRRRPSAWGALLGEQQILLASLVVQANGSVRVAVFEHQHTPAGLVPPDESEGWLVQQLRAASANLPRQERCLGLALQAGRCRQGVYQAAAGGGPRQWLADVRLEAAMALAAGPDEIGFDVDPPFDAHSTPPLVHWAACLRQDLQRWQDQAQRAGWRLPVVEPEQQSARRAALCLHGDVRALAAQSPQDWLFDLQARRTLGDAQWQALQSAPQWGALVACGAALGLLA